MADRTSIPCAPALARRAESNGSTLLSVGALPLSSPFVPFRNHGGLPGGSTLNLEYNVHVRNLAGRLSSYRGQPKVGKGSIIMGLVWIGIAAAAFLGIGIGYWS